MKYCYTCSKNLDYDRDNTLPDLNPRDEDECMNWMQVLATLDSHWKGGTQLKVVKIDSPGEDEVTFVSIMTLNVDESNLFTKEPTPAKLEMEDAKSSKEAEEHNAASIKTKPRQRISQRKPAYVYQRWLRVKQLEDQDC